MGDHTVKTLMSYPPITAPHLVTRLLPGKTKHRLGNTKHRLVDNACFLECRQ